MNPLAVLIGLCGVLIVVVLAAFHVAWWVFVIALLIGIIVLLIAFILSIDLWSS